MSIRKKIAVIILVFAALISAGFYFGYQKNSEFTQETVLPAEVPKPKTEKPPATEIKPPVPAIISGYKLYKNTDFGFEIQYPVSWVVVEEVNENVRGEMVKEFFFKKPNSDLRFAILPRDGLSYGLTTIGTSTPVFIGGFSGMQTQYTLKDGRRLWLLSPRYRLYNWLEDLGRIDAMTSVEDSAGDTQIFEQMLSSFKLAR
ncbi:MAG: hypothetical protein Q7K16_04380 [Candidatus Azambacteria bacterium]|nr:hypothetical protein [Candidatus Azambacteria bacterium]